MIENSLNICLKKRHILAPIIYNCMSHMAQSWGIIISINYYDKLSINKAVNLVFYADDTNNFMAEFIFLQKAYSPNCPYLSNFYQTS